MIAIETKYHAATNTRGTRYSASTCNGQRMIMSADYSLDAEGNQRKIAELLADKYDWRQHPESKRRFELVGGGTKNGMAWVFVEIKPPRAR